MLEQLLWVARSGKRLWIQGAIVLALILGLSTATVLPAKAAPNKASYDNLLAQLSATVQLLDQRGWSIASIHVDRLEKGQSYEFRRDLYSGNDYVIVGVGDSG